MFREVKQSLGRRVRRIRKGFLSNRWGNLAFRVALKTGQDRTGDMAAAIAYYILMSAFPLVLGLIGLLGLFLPSQSVQSSILDFFSTYLPGTASEVIISNIDAVIRIRGPLGVVGLFALLWSGSAVFSSINRFVNYAWGTTARPFHLRKLQDFALLLGTGLLFLVSQGVAGFAVITTTINPPELGELLGLAGRFLAFVLAFLVFLLIYRFMPNTKVRWRDALPGAVLGAVLFEALRTLFALYLSMFGNYTDVYGPLASVIVFLVWVFVSAYVLILGAEFASEWGKDKRPLSPPG